MRLPNPGTSAKKAQRQMQQCVKAKGAHTGCAPYQSEIAGKNPAADQAEVAIAFTRDARRDILRATVFLCSTPFVMPRANSG